MIQLFKEQRDSQILREGKLYDINTFIFYNEEGIQFKEHSHRIKIKQVRDDDFSNRAIISFDVTDFFSKAKVKRKPDFQKDEFFIMENKGEHLWRVEYDLYIPLKLIPLTKKTKELKNDYKTSFYKEEVVKYSFCGDLLKKGLSFHYEEIADQVYIKQIWEDGKLEDFHNALSLKTSLSSIKYDLLDTQKEAISYLEVIPYLLEVATKIDNFVKKKFSSVSDYSSEGLQMKDSEITGYIFISEDYKMKREIHKENYPTEQQFYYYLCCMLEAQVNEIELLYGSTEHRAGKKVKII